MERCMHVYFARQFAPFLLYFLTCSPTHFTSESKMMGHKCIYDVMLPIKVNQKVKQKPAIGREERAQ